jgi:hypothetical protein
MVTPNFHSFVPRLDVELITPPVERPNSAL